MVVTSDPAVHTMLLSVFGSALAVMDTTFITVLYSEKKLVNKSR